MQPKTSLGQTDLRTIILSRKVSFLMLQASGLQGQAHLRSGGPHRVLVCPCLLCTLRRPVCQPHHLWYFGAQQFPVSFCSSLCTGMLRNWEAHSLREGCLVVPVKILSLWYAYSWFGYRALSLLFSCRCERAHPSSLGPYALLSTWVVL